MFGRADIIVMPDARGRRMRILRLEGAYQSACYEGEDWAEPPFAYYRAFDAIFEAPAPEGRPYHVLMLGGGGFAWPKHVLMGRADVQLDVVELDPRIVDIARDRFHLDELESILAEQERHDDLRIIVDDAASFLKRVDGRYDAIINDVFQGARVPAQTSTEAFLADVKRHLHPQGIYAQNVIIDLARESPYQLFTLMTTLKGMFARICTLEAADEQFGGAENHIILATDGPASFEGAIPFP